MTVGILLSIHPEYAEAILAGTKTVGFRRRVPINVSRVVLYATMPVGRIVKDPVRYMQAIDPRAVYPRNELLRTQSMAP